MAEFWLGLGKLCIYFLICASTAVVIRLFSRVPDEVFRKLLHMILLGSLMIWLHVYSKWWLAALSALFFALAVYPLLYFAERLKGYSKLLTERSHGELKNSLLIVLACLRR